MEDIELRPVVRKDTGFIQGERALKYAGERNDLKVQVELFMTDFELVDTCESFSTDVHFFSRWTATFNWRILKRVKLPLAALSAKVRKPSSSTTSAAYIKFDSRCISTACL